MTPAEFQAILEQGTLLKRLPTLAEVADTAAFIASDGHDRDRRQPQRRGITD